MANDQPEAVPSLLEQFQQAAASAPDVMNDPAFDPSRRRKEKGAEEGDTCRICRGEGSAEEPLFYPCKCSGSIKFVHQHCLLEWLSHSQKKHCELCKTPFRFTKLYDPQMPSTVPLLVFVKQGALHILRSLLTWARWNLVILVWLGWVPWCMRMVWRSLFYLGDGGWITAQEIERRLATESSAPSEILGTSPASNGLPMSTAANAEHSSASIGALLFHTWSTKLNPDGSAPIMLRFFQKIFRIALYPLPELASAAKNSTSSVMGPGNHRSSSLLSGYPFLNNLTRSAAINNLAIDIIEGQLITLLVVIGFILVFLIREWVVQQQPVVNAGLALDAGVERPAAEADIEAGAQNDAQEPQGPTTTEHTDEEVVVPSDPEFAVDDLAETWEQASSDDSGSRPSTEPFQELIVPVDEAVETDDRANETTEDAELRPNEPPNRSSPTRPSLPYRGALSPASEIRRTLEEEALVSGQTWPGVDVFMDLWRRAESDPEEVLRIIRADGRENELSWIVSAMARLQNGLPPQSVVRPGESSSIAKELGGEQTLDDSWLVFDDESTQSTVQSQEPLAKSQESETQLPTPPADTIPPLDLTAIHRARMERLQESTQSADTASVSTQIGANAQEASEPNEEMANPRVQDRHGLHPSSALEDEAARDTIGSPSVELAERPEAANDLAGTVRNWLWGDIPAVEEVAEDPGEDDVHVVEDMAAEAPFVPFANGQLMIENRDDEEEEEAEHQDPEVLRAAAEAGINPNDPDGIEDGEDLEGILELIGVQGPLIGLIQNGLFSALLIAISFIAGIWVPYIVGKVVLVFAANPVALFLKMPLRWISALADSIVDSVVFLAGAAFCAVDACIRITAIPVGWALPFVRHASRDRLIGKTAYRHTLKSANRLAQTLVESADMFSESDIPLFSIVAHESLVAAKSRLYQSLVAVVTGIEVFVGCLKNEAFNVQNAFTIMRWIVTQSANFASNMATSIRSAVTKINFQFLSLHVDFDTPQRSSPIDYSLAYWSTQDRVIAILIGYAFFCVVGSAYLNLYSRAKDDQGERARSTFIDILQQAGGVTKVILIISIEMIVFPLYCGALLDIALLPLFKEATLASRLNFTVDAPLTSTFIHWFIGTCYMFHFALFVSMCRRILRTGVLYFIRDPDDPSFHPVRDVLERNVSTQLRKIAFSALVYGGLVIVCLGAVVWGLDRMTASIFPIRWTSSAPVLESPVDLLVYNFVMPFAITFTEPATVLHAVYRWWFRKCARWLRLTHFFFGERIEDEMYIFVRDPFKHVRVKDSIPEEEHLNEERRLTQSREIASYYLNGYFVRAPASDQVRLPKGTKTFVPVDELGHRADGLPDTDQGLHGRNNRLFKKIFIPHRFGVRVTIFLALLWMFAGVTGVGCTMIPLLFGRWLFGQLCPPEFQVNDIYAFAVGAYMLGVPLHLAIRFYPTLHSAVMQLVGHPLRSYVSMSTFKPVLRRIAAVTMRILRLAYFYGTLGLILPALTGLLWEMYVVIPLLTLSHATPTPPYTIRFVQAWTLAVVALKFGTKVVLERPETAPARALRALVNPTNRGASWADPDVRLATRAIVMPALVLLALGLVVPPALAAGVLHFADPGDDSLRPLVFRYAYPAVLGVGLSVLAGRGLGKGLRVWRERVRDEVFLVGERLHNFGERTAGTSHVGRPGAERRGSQRVELE